MPPPAQQPYFGGRRVYFGAMSPADLKTWRTGLGLSKAAAARRLGYSRARYAQIEGGFDTIRKRPLPVVPPVMALACAALYFGIAAYPDCVAAKE